MSLIVLSVQPIATVPAGGATPTARKQQPFYRMFERNCHVLRKLFCELIFERVLILTTQINA
jgi:hypothetical protein